MGAFDAIDFDPLGFDAEATTVVAVLDPSYRRRVARMATAASNSFEFSKGEDVEIRWTIKESSAADAAVMDITGWTFAMKVKRQDSDDDADIVIAPTLTITDAENGSLTAAFAAASMDLLEGDYRYSLWRTNAGSVSCLSKGFFSVVDTTQS